MKKFDTQITRALTLILETKKVLEKLGNGCSIQKIKDLIHKENFLAKNTDSTRKKIWYDLTK